MATREEFVAEVRSWLGTPYRHQGRQKGVAVDCGGLVACSALAVTGRADFDVEGYERWPDGSLEQIGADHFDPVEPGAWLPGDVLLFRWDGGQPCHVGVITSVGEQGAVMCHAHLKDRRVVEHRLDTEWLSRVAGAYRVRGLE